ncbi:MAG: virulence factor SrfB [Chitinophagaceae bacterium]|nr:virulence factor SrfB [Chitinophagaceae bacterium]
MVDKYLLKQFHQLENIKDYKGQKPKLNYLAQYIYLIRYIQQQDILPKITLYSNENVAYAIVDLVVDIGNSRTCAVLFDNGDFTKMSPLELQDFTTPVFNGELNKYHDSFDMRLAFREADFGGKLGIENSRQFIYPSMIRLGKEANRLIHKATNMNTGAEKTSTFSSPKRFLWDTKPQKQEWEFVQLDGETAKPIYIEGISEQLNMDGSLNTSGDGGILMHYSRRALMTFAFLEILAQANMQINSYEQRKHWGNESMPRQIGRIIVTCPTAMSRIEQVSLRKCAEDAAIMLDRFFKDEYRKEIDEKEAVGKVQVIPSAKNLSLKEERTEWIYDEATAAQFVFLYAEINQRYLKNVKEYFDLYGKIRKDLQDYDKKSLTIGSVDIGAGTTDVMIAAYKYEDSGQCNLTPVPLFWESFTKPVMIC